MEINQKPIFNEETVVKQEPSFSERQRSRSSSYEPRSSNNSLKLKRRRSNDSLSDSSQTSPISEYATCKRQKSEFPTQLGTMTMLNNFVDIIKGINDPNMPFDNLLPQFDPSKKHHTISAWLNKVDQLAEIYGWNEAQKIHFALEKLSGSAKTWLQSRSIVLHKWSEWRASLCEAFRENYAQLLGYMLSIRVEHGESLVNYYYVKTGLLSSCHIEGRDAVDCLLDGIVDDVVRMGAYAARLKTPEQVICYFQAVEETHSSKSSRSKNRLKNRKLQCFNCGLDGHKTYRCFKPKTKCPICYKRGHLDRFCWAREHM